MRKQGKAQKNLLNKIVIKPKPWGREIWFAWTKDYAGKILEIKNGHSFSLQYHEKKRETQFVVKGKVKLSFGNSVKNLRHKILMAGQKVDIPPRLLHRMKALEKTIVFEVSSPELDDVVKVTDDYGRTGRGNNEKLDRKLSSN